MMLMIIDGDMVVKNRLSLEEERHGGPLISKLQFVKEQSRNGGGCV